MDALFTYEFIGTQAVLDKNAQKIAPGAVENYVQSPWQAGVWAVSKNFGTRRPEEARNFILAIYDAVDFIRSHPDDAKVYLSKYTNIRADVANKTPNIPFTKIGEVDISALQTQSDILTQRKVLSKHIDNIARYLGVGRTTIERAEAVVEAAEDDPEEYGHLADQMDRSGKVAGAYRRLTVLKQAKELEAKPASLPAGPFQVIVADSPWRYESGNDLPYPTMAIEEIKALPIRDIADQDAILWLWTTNAHLRVAFEVVECWGFQYKTLLTWVKHRMGTGEWLRGQTEHCLLATRGKPVFLHGTHTTVLDGSRREHSRKPEEFYSLVEATCPGDKVDLFSRQVRGNWRSYGSEVKKFQKE